MAPVTKDELFAKLFVPGTVLNGRYEVLSPVAYGAYGMVVLGRDCHKDKPVALKCLAKNPATSTEKQFFLFDARSEELSIHSRIPIHPNIVNFLDYFETDTRRYFVLEYCQGGDLYETIKIHKAPKETERVRAFMLQFIGAVEFLHGKGIYHRDIKPENIFLTETGDVKLGDFGLATRDKWSREAMVGSDRYMAPEQFHPNGQEISPEKADIWSVGICLLNIVFSANPFEVPAERDEGFKSFLINRNNLYDTKHFEKMHPDTMALLNHCLIMDPTKRSLASVKEALLAAKYFTTDDETLDEFFVEACGNATATDNRKPLKTPFATTSRPGIGRMVQANPNNRQLSVIQDSETVSEDLFPSSEASMQDWCSKADTRSINSTFDNMSVGSAINDTLDSPAACSKPVPIGSSWASLRSAFAFENKKGTQSLSWSDIQEEDDEEKETLKKPGLEQMSKPSQLNRVLPVGQIDISDDGRSTPRACLGEIKNAASLKTRTPSNESNESNKSQEKDERISEQTGFRFDEDHVSPPPVPLRTSPTADRWSLLTERRGIRQSVSSIMQETNFHKRSALTGTLRSSLTKKFSRQSTPAVRNEVVQQPEWNRSSNWRQTMRPSPGPTTSKPTRPHASQLDGACDMDIAVDEDDEYIGDWSNLQYLQL